jgi:ubiquinone/menaquinone biosynthesis C-methylase UbiE
MDNFIRRFISPPKKKISKFIRTGCVAADIGCGPGYFTIPMAEMTGPSGRVYAVDSDPKSIHAVKAKSELRGLEKILEATVTSAADMKCIPDTSIDFVFANAVLCCMADHSGAVAEIKRILKPDGTAYMSVARVVQKNDPRSVRREEWDRILSGFCVKEKEVGITNRWAVVSLRSGELN